MNRPRRYKLLKDLPNVEAGVILEWNDTKTWSGGPYKYGRYIIHPMPSDKSCNIVFTPEDVENNPEWFEPVVEKDWEIVKFSDNNGTYDSFYVGNRENWERNNLSNTNRQIHSVKRLSDGEVFSVGDEIRDARTAGKIIAFEIDGKDKMVVHFSNVFYSYLSAITKVPPQSKQEPESSRPPLGLMPEWLWIECRLKEVERAMERYIEANKDIPEEWEAERKKLQMLVVEREFAKKKYSHLPTDKVQINISFTHKNEGETSTVISYGFSVPFTGVVEEKYPSLKQAIQNVLK